MTPSIFTSPMPSCPWWSSYIVLKNLRPPIGYPKISTVSEELDAIVAALFPASAAAVIPPCDTFTLRGASSTFWPSTAPYLLGPQGYLFTLGQWLFGINGGYGTLTFNLIDPLTGDTYNTGLFFDSYDGSSVTWSVYDEFLNQVSLVVGVPRPVYFVRNGLDVTTLPANCQVVSIEYLEFI